MWQQRQMFFPKLKSRKVPGTFFSKKKPFALFAEFQFQVFAYLYLPPAFFAHFGVHNMNFAALIAARR